jgi:hypothetical protein
MATTPNKGYAVQNTGDNSGTWGSILNDDMISVVDNNLGGIVTKSVAGSNITLSSTDSQMAIVRLTGAQSADIQLTTSCIGSFFVENLTTNSFNITVVNDQVATGVVVPKGRSTVISDATNGCRIAGTDSFPPGTRMPFNQSAAPTGWTKDGSVDDAALRIVSGPVSSGGTIGFSTLFSGLVAGTIGGTALTVNQIPAHTHTVTSAGTRTGSNSANPGSSFFASSGNVADYGPKSMTSSGVGSGASHTHTFTGTTNLDVKYADFIIATKN